MLYRHTATLLLYLHVKTKKIDTFKWRWCWCHETLFSLSRLIWTNKLECFMWQVFSDHPYICKNGYEQQIVCSRFNHKCKTWLKIKWKKHSSGLYYKNIMIVNDASRVISEWCHNLKHHLRSSIMLPEQSIMLLDNINSTGVTHDDRHMTIIICL